MVTWSCYYTVWTDCIHSRFLRWTPTPNVSGQCLEMGLLDIIRFWWVHKVGSPSRISVFTSRGRDTGAAPSTCCPPSPSRERTLIRRQISQHLDLELPTLKKCGKIISFLKLPSLSYFFYQSVLRYIDTYFFFYCVYQSREIKIEKNKI